MENKQPVVLIVDDEPKFLESISERIRLKGFIDLPAASGEEALSLARQRGVDLAIVDQRMPGMDGITTITKLKEFNPDIRTVLLTGYGSDKLREAAEAVEAGYFEKDEMRQFWSFIRQYIEKSGQVVVDPDTGQISLMVAGQDSVRQSEPAAVSLPNARIFNARRILSPMTQLIGETSHIIELKKNIRDVAALDCSVMIIGEQGTGKKTVAKAIHSLSPRKDGLFIAFDCSAVEDDLLSRELFGDPAGDSTTGDSSPPSSANRKRGVFEIACGGVVLLERVDKTSPAIQEKLLRLLETGVISGGGGADNVHQIPLDVRILTTADRDLSANVADGVFPETLYERLNAVTVRVPPLRERINDLPLLSNYFLDVYRKEFGKNIRSFAEDVGGVLQHYPFPGNVRELEDVIKHAVIMCESDQVEKKHLSDRFREASASVSTGNTKDLVTLAELEDQYILKVMKATGGNKSETARILGINRASLWRKLKKRQLFTDNNQPIRLLVVDDDKKFLHVISERLGLRDFDVTTAAKGAEALETAGKGVFDVALVDLNMPGMKGQELLSVLKGSHQFLEVIILTGYGSVDSAVECMKLGAFGYLEKPYEFDQLLEMLKDAYAARLKKKFEQNAKRMAEIDALSAGSSPLTVLRDLKSIDDGMK